MFRLLVERGAILDSPATGLEAVKKARAGGLDSMLALLEEHGVRIGSTLTEL